MEEMSQEQIILKFKYELDIKKAHYSFNVGNKKVILGTFGDIGKGFKVTWKF